MRRPESRVALRYSSHLVEQGGTQTRVSCSSCYSRTLVEHGGTDNLPVSCSTCYSSRPARGAPIPVEVGGRALGPRCFSDWGRAVKGSRFGKFRSEVVRRVARLVSRGLITPAGPETASRRRFFSGYICPASNPMHFGRSLHWLRTMGRRSISRAIGMPGITFDATWPRSWMTATHGLPLGVHSPGARRVWRNSNSNSAKKNSVFFDYQGQAKPGPNLPRGLLHPATVHVFKSSPMLGGRLPIKLKSRHRGVVVRDLKGRERAVRGGAEPPPGLKKCSWARQGGRGERLCLLITGYRGVDGTFVNGHRRLYRTHPGPAGWRCIIGPSSLCTPGKA